MEERRISTGASCFLIKDERLKKDWHNTPIYTYLKEEGFEYQKGSYSIEGIDWLYVNIYSKVFAKGRGGIALTKVVGDHAITFEEFKTIYNIFKKYEGFSTLKMNEQEQKEFYEYCARCEADKPKWEAWKKEFCQPPEQMTLEEYKQKVRKCLIDMNNYTPEEAGKLMATYNDDFEEALYDFKWPPNVMAGAMIFGYQLWTNSYTRKCELYLGVVTNVH